MIISTFGKKGIFPIKMSKKFQIQKSPKKFKQIGNNSNQGTKSLCSSLFMLGLIGLGSNKSLNRD